MSVQTDFQKIRGLSPNTRPKLVPSRYQISKGSQQIILIQPGGVHNAGGARRGIQRLKPTFRVLQVVGVVVPARHGTETEAGEMVQAWNSLFIIPAHNVQLFG